MAAIAALLSAFLPRQSGDTCRSRSAAGKNRVDANALLAKFDGKPISSKTDDGVFAGGVDLDIRKRDHPERRGTY